MIKPIDLRRLINSEFVEFFDIILALNLGKDPTVLGVKKEYDALFAHQQKTQKQFKKVQSSPVTKEIKEADKRRDKALSGMMTIVAGFKKDFKPEVVAAANLLFDSYRVYGTGIIKKNYAAETAIVENLCNDWENNTELKAAIVTLNLSAWVTEIKTSNELFRTKYKERAVTVSADKSDKNFKDLRDEQIVLYQELKTMLVSQTVVLKLEVQHKLIDEMNYIIDKFNSLH